ncbi:ATP-dependent Clp protease adaptor ClpS [Moraxella marmotae]|uniref:ATP-dependent Clp protease adaptor ClpS n=1 Tax=Moraxella marmotae TaxID=3344520 RepID=UPI0035D4709D
MTDFNQDTDSDVAVQTEPLTKHPKLYAVVMHNDDYTTMEFVVFALVEIFGHSVEKAYQLMMQIHQTGRSAVAALPYEIAEMKVEEVTLLAEQESYPLLTTIEPL